MPAQKTQRPPVIQPSPFWKALYLIASSSHVFGMPYLRGLRNRIYSAYLGGVRDLNVANGVLVRTAHSSPSAKISVGDGFRMGDLAEVDYSGGITFGENVTISEGVRVFTHEHLIDGEPDWRKNPIEFSHLEVGAFAWLGANCLIMPSVCRIGEGAVIAAGAVVSKNVADFEVVGGVPAKHLRMRNVKSDED